MFRILVRDLLQSNSGYLEKAYWYIVIDFQILIFKIKWVNEIGII